MTRFIAIVLLTAMTVLGTEGTPSTSVPTDKSSLVTFNKDVLPILQNNCQECHRPGGIAPMSLLTYENARPWAKAIKTAVVNKQMPPWFADPHVGDFRNSPKLTAENIKTLAAWADTGSREGDAADKPANTPQWKEGWRIQPDVVVSMTEPQLVAANGPGEIKQYVIPNPFTEDTWVTSIEIRPGNPSVVHHAIVQVFEPTEIRAVKVAAPQNVATTAQVALQGVATPLQNFVNEFVVVTGFVGQGSGSYSDIIVRNQERQTGKGAFMTMEAVYAPGSQPLDFRYTNSAKLVPGERPIRLEVHYQPNGELTTDQTSIGFTLAKAPAPRQFVFMAPEHLVDIRRPIPAGQSNYETKGELTFNQDVDLAWFMPHMHLRGKDMTYRLIFPDGHEQTVLSANFNFNWQLGYELESPIRIRRGTQMVVVAHHDNSANNPYNPDPTREVAWGNLTSEEMVLPWFGVLVDKNADPEKILAVRQSSCSIANSLLSTIPGAVSGPAGTPRLPIPSIPTPKVGK